MAFLTVVGALAFGCSNKKKPETMVTGGEVAAGDDNWTKTTHIEPDPVTPSLDEQDIDGDDLTGKEIALDDVYFDFDSYELRADQRATLESNSRWLLANTKWNVSIEGHCDERGTDEYNLALGDKRANSVSSWLQHRGVAAARIQTISYGEAYPVDPGHSEAAWGKNRRAHFLLVPGGGR